VSALFGLTLFATSLLLFVVEPLIGKGLLPALGGGATVWTTTAAFFQLALLVGYLYAHAAPAWLGLRRHAALHVALLALLAWTFVRGAALAPAPAVTQDPSWWLFGALARTVGPPFVLLAASTPLLHRWIAAARRARPSVARDPYFLFAVSNAGSLAALLAFPLVLEPTLSLARQRGAWTLALIPVAALVALCAWSALGRGASEDGTPTTDAEATRWPERARWLVLAAVPSSLLLSVTSYVSTDLAPMPLLWVLPLALYLLTFILAFARRTVLPPALVWRLQPVFMLLIAVEFHVKSNGPAWPLIPLHGAAFFFVALGCHQSLAAARPSAARSTEFYLWVAAGGALGGLFNVFAAPRLFSTLFEYPLGMIAAALLLPRGAGWSDVPRERRLDVALPLALGAALLAATALAARLPAEAPRLGRVVAQLVVPLALAGAAGYAFRTRPLRFGLALAVITLVGLSAGPLDARVVLRERSFYGVHTVADLPSGIRVLQHGTTVHGAQDLSPGRRREPLTYYHPTGPIGDVMAHVAGKAGVRIGVVGLGTGALAAYAGAGERWSFFELDPTVVAIARDRGVFTYLADARADVEMIVGDARQTLAAIPDGTLELLVLDAFSSDSVPAHLLTAEALQLYLRKVTPRGLVAFHVSNRFLDLAPVVAAAAAANAPPLVARTRADRATPAEARGGKASSIWTVVARADADLGPLAADPRWRASPPGVERWTDDKSDVWSVLHVRATEALDFSER
jgi:hypothetical protein